jgi:hypothetical protein
VVLEKYKEYNKLPNSARRTTQWYNRSLQLSICPQNAILYIIKTDKM